MKKKVFLSVLLSSVITMALTVAIVISVIYVRSEKALRDEVKNEAIYVSEALNTMDDAGSSDYIAVVGKNTENRITLITPDGTVTYDSFATADTMDNHLGRPEVADAAESGSGEATRYSDTLGEKIYYYAVKLDSGEILRIANTTKSALGIIGNALGMSFFLLAYILIISFVVANILTRAIVKPLESLNLDEPLKNETYDELSPLLGSLDKKNKKISLQLEKLSAKQREFDYIITSMSEGLVILGSNGNILLANKSAVKILGGDNAKSYLELCRDVVYIRIIEEALGGRPSSEKMERDGRFYQLNISSVANEGSYAAVLFIVDITEREQAERLRREFSANVSHELKTPLTSIMGYAEIIGNGIAKKADIPRFAEQINSEAGRLLKLIEDIIRLSQLDEADLKQEFEPVKLSEICTSVVSELAEKARTADVSLTFDGGEAVINGYVPVLHEMIFNLCDNAITYNKPQGTVAVSLKNEDSKAILTVADTGIGIAREHQSRVFERFYRVDTSHSKETGGTGLGLSIVKHAALLHGAQLSLESSPGKGTTVTVEFNMDSPPIAIQ